MVDNVTSCSLSSKSWEAIIGHYLEAAWGTESHRWLWGQGLHSARITGPYPYFYEKRWKITFQEAQNMFSRHVYVCVYNLFFILSFFSGYRNEITSINSFILFNCRQRQRNMTCWLNCVHLLWINIRFLFGRNFLLRNLKIFWWFYLYMWLHTFLELFIFFLCISEVYNVSWRDFIFLVVSIWSSKYLLYLDAHIFISQDLENLQLLFHWMCLFAFNL
jgi:hypothetical protein